MKNLRLLLMITFNFLIISFGILKAEENLGIDSLLRNAQIFFIDNKYDSAQKLFEQVLDLDKNNVTAYLGLAKVIYQQMDIFNIQSNKNYNQAKFSEKYGSNNNRFRFSRAIDYVQEALKIDPDNIEANYLGAILLREKMRYRFALSRSGSFEDGTKYIQRAINQNPKYKDSYLQYAMLFRFYDKFIEALDTCMKGIEINPSLSQNYLGYRRIAHHFFSESDIEEVKSYTSVETDIFKNYLDAEFERLNGNVDKSVGMLKKILNNYYFTPQFYTNHAVFPVALLYSSLLKAYAAKREESLVYDTFWEAVENIKYHPDADIIFDDIKYLASEEELSRYMNSSISEKRNRFFRAFWNRRHPITNMNYSQRLIEHYERIVHAEKEYPQNRERALFKNPANSYEANFEFYDQGLVFLKHGEPDKINKTSTYSIDGDNPPSTISEVSTDTSFTLSIKPLANDSSIYNGPINEAWLYNESPYNKKMIFCFIGLSKKLTSNFFDREILKDLENWDEKFFRYIHAYNSTNEDEMLQKIVDEGAEQIYHGISSERSTIKSAEKEIILPNEIYEMKGENGNTHLKIAYLLPYNILLNEISQKKDTIKIETGYMILDREWQVAAMKLDTIYTTVEDKKSLSQIKYLFLDVKPDSSEINLFFNPMNSEITCFFKKRSKVKDFSDKILNMSDIVIAIKIENADKAGFFTRNGLDIIPSPTSKYPADKLLNLYYEVYGLKKNSDGKTMYNVEYSFKYTGGEESFFEKIFGGNEVQSISTEYSKSGKDSDSNEFISFDLNKMKKGFYDVEITIKDINAQKSVKRLKKIEIYD